MRSPTNTLHRHSATYRLTGVWCVHACHVTVPEPGAPPANRRFLGGANRSIPRSNWWIGHGWSYGSPDRMVIECRPGDFNQWENR
ncbi:hypothetical protein E2C01_008167 [Portunus trituberculatus]|uniref:Uncharacterized protein n=1 Tax=Portunus trituberculatus TaxID=210409 RepID=A0A5B7D436_PORTR|nr:hypothetical protein [Portunus trituberculatus]